MDPRCRRDRRGRRCAVSSGMWPRAARATSSAIRSRGHGSASCIGPPRPIRCVQPEWVSGTRWLRWGPRGSGDSAVRGLELDGQVGRDPSSAGDFDALRPRPLPHFLRAVSIAGASGQGTASARSARLGPTAGLDVGCQHLPQSLGVLCAQVDGVRAAVQPERDCLRGFAAIEIVGEFDYGFWAMVLWPLGSGRFSLAPSAR